MQRNESSTPTFEDSGEVVDERMVLLASIANTIKDYRADDRTVARPTSDHVERWAGQFDEEIRIPLLREIDHILKRTYLTKDSCVAFLKKVAMQSPKDTDDPRSFWEKAKFLHIQPTGNSQNEMMDMLDRILMNEYGFQTSDCGKAAVDAFVYLDDGVFTGNRVKKDLIRWIKDEAPDKATVYIVTVVLHRSGRRWADDQIQINSMISRKSIDIQWRERQMIEDELLSTGPSDVLQPSSLPDGANVLAYVASLRYPVKLRTCPGRGENKIFSSEDGRNLVEQIFLKFGLDIWHHPPYFLPSCYRPLGNSFLDTLGFGSMVVTYRNCPNTAPLALWACEYPLFPRQYERR